MLNKNSIRPKFDSARMPNTILGEFLTAFLKSNHVLTLFHLLAQLIVRLVSSLEKAFLHLTQPFRNSIVLSAVADLTRSKPALIAENALLRQQLVILLCWLETPSVPDLTPMER